MAPMARELSSKMGVLEPLQTAGSIDGQVEELKDVLETHGNPPLILVGFSWGAWLSFIFAAQYPSLIKKLILVSSPPFTEKYVPQIMETRLNHLNSDERQEALSLLSAIYSGSAKGNSFARFGDLMDKADSFAPLPHDDEILLCRPVIYQQVWTEAGKMRSIGELLQLAGKIQCPVVAIQGGYDPHPAAGVQEPLARILQDFNFIPLAKCGYHPWFEREAKGSFYAELKREIGAHE